jgi:acetyl esterase/lipase
VHETITVDSSLAEVIGTREFAGFGHLVLPSAESVSRGATVADIARLLPYHSNIDPSEAAGTLNILVAGVREGRITFHLVYDSAEVAREPGKADVGLFAYRGEPGEPFGIVCAGGGFSYVGSVHEGFPHARAISERGFNAFVLNYRTGNGGRFAMEDLAAAIDYVLENRESLAVSTDTYSLWGSSAGARMAAGLGSHGTQSFGRAPRPRAGTVVMAYTGHSDYTRADPATFAVVGSHDRIASPATMEARIRRLQQAGVTAELHRYQRLGHGFGMGTGTVAEGWVDAAIRFWEEQIAAG